CKHYQVHGQVCNKKEYRHSKDMIYCNKLRTVIYLLRGKK
ncbi:unnamed protein product, partial [marine sediment metagenome]